MKPERLAKIRALVARSADIGKSMSADLLSALEAAERERDALKEALKPFATRCGHYEPPYGELAEDTDMAHDCYATVGDLRAARRALEAKQQEDKPEPKRQQTFQEKQNEYDEDNWGCEND